VFVRSVLRAGPLPAESGAVDVPHLKSCPSRAVARDSGKPNFGGFSLDVKLSPIYLDIKLPTGITPPQAGLPELLAARAGCEGAARALVGDTDYDTAFRQGLRLDLHTAIAYALGEEKDLPPAEPAGKPALTRREFEVADRLALGMSNREIAENLVIARRTVDSHVEHILAKLGFTSRTQIAAWISTRQS
jgi:DNA-binding CsgD family transcriptional regulator